MTDKDRKKRVWTDDLVKEFVRDYASGSYGIYKDAKTIDEKLEIFKEKKHHYNDDGTLKPIVKATRLIEWHYSDLSSSDIRAMFGEIATTLRDTGSYSIDVTGVWQGTGYIPVHICENEEDLDSTIEYDICDCILINDYEI